MKKKFKVRIKRYYKNKYCIQYSNNYLFPYWNTLEFWSATNDEKHYMQNTNIFNYSTLMMPIDEAENFAKNLKSMEEINNFLLLQYLKELEFNKMRSEYLAKTLPIEIKNII
jgi:hypothetical protein